jgi:hypothetical protein
MSLKKRELQSPWYSRFDYTISDTAPTSCLLNSTTSDQWVLPGLTQRQHQAEEHMTPHHRPILYITETRQLQAPIEFRALLKVYTVYPLFNCYLVTASP